MIQFGSGGVRRRMVEFHAFEYCSVMVVVDDMRRSKVIIRVLVLVLVFGFVTVFSL